MSGDAIAFVEDASWNGDVRRRRIHRHWSLSDAEMAVVRADRALLDLVVARDEARSRRLACDRSCLAAAERREEAAMRAVDARLAALIGRVNLSLVLEDLRVWIARM